MTPRGTAGKAGRTPGRRPTASPTGFGALGFGLVLALAATAARAADEDGAPERIVVRAPRLAPAFEPTLDPVAFGSVIDTTTAPRWVTSLADALDDAVGVRVRRFGGLGEFSSVSVRGFSPGQVQVYLDGVPISRADDETVDLGELPLEAIERVEVYRGTTSLDFAQSSPGGVVNVVPRRPTGERLLAASLGAGSFGTRKATLAAGGEASGWEYLAFGHYLGSENDFRFESDFGTPEQPRDDVRLRRVNADFDGGGLTTRLRRDVTDDFHLLVTTDTFAKEQGLPGRDPVQAAGDRRDVLRQLVSLDGVLDSEVGRLPVESRGSTYFVYRRERVRVPECNPAADPACGPAATPRDTLTDSFSTGGQLVTRVLLADWLVPRALVALGYETFDQRDDTAVSQTTSAGRAPTRSRLRTTLGADVEASAWDGRVTVVPAIRWEHVRDDFPRDPRTNPALDVGASGTTSRDVLAPRIGVRAEPGGGLTLLANAGRWERVPNLRELFGVSGTVVGRPDLDSERARSWDAGARWRPPVRGPLGDAWVEYAYYESRIDDAIVLLPSSVNVFRPANVAAARLRGHEVSGAVTVGPVGASVNYTRLEARDLGEDLPIYDGNQLPGRPEDEVFARLDVGWPAPAGSPLGAGTAFYELSYVGPTFLDRANVDRVDARLVHGVGVELALPRRVRVGLEVRNLTDDQTRDAADFPLPGRAAFVTVSYGFGPDDGR